MPGGDHFVIDKFVFCPEVALQAFFRAMNHAARVGHPQRHGLFMQPRTRGVGTEPSRGRPMTVFAGYAFRNFKRAPPLFGRSVERMARQAFWSLLGVCAQFQDARHAFADVPRQRLIRAAVLVLKDPH